MISKNVYCSALIKLFWISILCVNKSQGLLAARNSQGLLEEWKPLQSDVAETIPEGYNASLSVYPQEVSCVRGDTVVLNYTMSGTLMDCVNLTMISTTKVITVLPAGPLLICPKNASNGDYFLYMVNTTKEGIVVLEITADPDDIYTEKAFVSLSSSISPAINTIGDIIGWLYTIAWDISFLPQIVHNWRRQSVIGLSFDFLTFNFIGFSCYFLFNMGLCWLPAIQGQYYERNPTSFLHVRLNDVIFPLYAVICTAVQIIQCFIYERGNQRVSTTCRLISAAMLVSIVIYGIVVAAVNSLWWIDFLYYLSYIKLAITCIKYTPQLYQNYKLKSTEGWSIWQVILDFTGGSLSLVQMFLLAHNYDDVQSVLTDPTKLGLGLLSVFFNILFFIQHFGIYRHNDQKMDLQEKKEKPADVATISSKPI